MGYHPNEGKGIVPQENVLYYKKVDEKAGITMFAKVDAWKIDKQDNYTAWVTHPVTGTDIMNSKQGTIEGFEPVFALVEEDIPRIVEAIVEKYEARIKALEDVLSDLLEEPAAETAPVVPHQCECGFGAKNATGLSAHRRHCDAAKAASV